MTVQEIIDTAMSLVGGDFTVNVYPADHLVDILNECTVLLQGAVNEEAVYEVAVLTGTQEVDLPLDAYEVLGVELDGTPLKFVERADYWSRGYKLDRGKVVLQPAVPQDSTLRLRYKVKLREFSPGNMSAEPQIPPQFHMAYAYYLAFRLSGLEGANMLRRDYYEAFASLYNEIRSYYAAKQGQTDWEWLVRRDW